MGGEALMVRIQLIDQYGQIVDGIDVTVKATRRSLPDILEWIESAFESYRQYGLEPKITVYC